MVLINNNQTYFILCMIFELAFKLQNLKLWISLLTIIILVGIGSIMEMISIRRFAVDFSY